MKQLGIRRPVLFEMCNICGHSQMLEAPHECNCGPLNVKNILYSSFCTQRVLDAQLKTNPK